MSDPEKVIGRSHYVAGLSLLAFAPFVRRADILRTSRGGAAAGTWIFRGDERRYYAEVAGTPKEPYLFWIGLCAVLGTLAESGKISQWAAARAVISRGAFSGDMEIAVTPRMRRGYSVETGRGDAVEATWIFRGDGSRRRRGRDVDIPWRRVSDATTTTRR